MTKPEFVYVTFIRTTPEQLWTALTSPEFTEQYWFGRRIESDWRPGSSLKVWVDKTKSDLDFAGEVLRCEPPRVLSYTFGAQWGDWVRGMPDGEAMSREPASRVTYELHPMGAVVRLTVTHENFPAKSKVLDGIRSGWPAILSNLKSVLETGKALMLRHEEFVDAAR